MNRKPHLNVGIVGFTISTFKHGIWNVLFVTPMRTRDVLLEQNIPTAGIVQTIELAPTPFPPPTIDELAIIGQPSLDDCCYPETRISVRNVPIKWDRQSFKHRHVRIHRSPEGTHFHG
jgi:hypothetical protein